MIPEKIRDDATWAEREEWIRSLPDLPQNNRVVISGHIEREIVFDHESGGEKFYRTFVKVKRNKSKNNDIVPCILPKAVLENCKESIQQGKRVEIFGEVRTAKGDTSHNLRMYVFVRRWSISEANEEAKDVNLVFLQGEIFKQPIYRVTPLGRQITEVMVAVKRPNFDRTFYIPCIVWEKMAYFFINNFEMKDGIHILGKYQSREYYKVLNPETDEREKRIAYEISLLSFDWNDRQKRRDSTG